MITVEKILAAMAKKKIPFVKRDFEYHTFGVRHPDLSANTFNDLLGGFMFRPAGVTLLVGPGTTDPGVYYRLNPSNVQGTGRLPVGHYPNLWRVGMHQGKYRALTQNVPVAVIRDNDKNATLDAGKLSAAEMIGLNRHKAGNASSQVDNWSAACQVWAADNDFACDMLMVDDQIENLKKETVSYTLFDWADFQ